MNRHEYYYHILWIMRVIVKWCCMTLHCKRKSQKRQNGQKEQLELTSLFGSIFSAQDSSTKLWGSLCQAGFQLSFWKKMHVTNSDPSDFSVCHKAKKEFYSLPLYISFSKAYEELLLNIYSFVTLLYILAFKNFNVLGHV